MTTCALYVFLLMIGFDYNTITSYISLRVWSVFSGLSEGPTAPHHIPDLHLRMWVLPLPRLFRRLAAGQEFIPSNERREREHRS